MKKTWFNKVLLAACLLWARQEAAAAPFPVGNNADPMADGAVRDIYFQNGSWTIPLTELVFDPSAAPYLKVLHGPQPTTPPRRGVPVAEAPLPSSVDGSYTLVENLLVSGQAWTDWHEEIVYDQAGANDTGWDFIGASYQVSGSGENKSFIYGLGTDLVDFVFDQAIQAGSTLHIEKILKWNGLGAPITPVYIAEHPTVPVPATIWLLGAGVVALVGSRKKTYA